LGIYVMRWGRRWIAPFAGWAGVFVVLMPGFVRFSNGVLPNVPATALAFAALYHFRVWQDTAQTRPLKIFCLLAVATVLTYFPAVTILPVALAWSLRNSNAGRSK